MAEYFFPIILFNTRIYCKEFQFTDYAYLRRLTSKERQNILNIKSIKWHHTTNQKLPCFGSLTWSKIKHVTKNHQQSLFFGGVEHEFSHMVYANYVIVYNSESDPSRAFIRNINFAFSLFRLTSTGIYAGYRADGNLIIQPDNTHPSPFGGKYVYISLSRQNLEIIQNLFHCRPIIL